jgi:hypothetical protein
VRRGRVLHRDVHSKVARREQRGCGAPHGRRLAGPQQPGGQALRGRHLAVQQVLLQRARHPAAAERLSLGRGRVLARLLQQLLNRGAAAARGDAQHVAQRHAQQQVALPRGRGGEDAAPERAVAHNQTRGGARRLKQRRERRRVSVHGGGRRGGAAHGRAGRARRGARRAAATRMRLWSSRRLQRCSTRSRRSGAAQREHGWQRRPARPDAGRPRGVLARRTKRER